MAYALKPLIQIIEQDYDHLIVNNKHQIESLLQKARNLRDLIPANSSLLYSEEFKMLDRLIRKAAQAAEDIIEPHMADRVHSNFAGPTSQLDLTRVMEGLDFITKQMLEIVEGRERQTDQHVSSSSCVVSLPPQPDMISANIEIGFEEVMDNMLNDLTGDKKSLEIISVVGMGGVGKTTLARELYNNSKISHHFEIRGWVTVSQNSNARVTLLALLNSLVKITEEMCKGTEDELGVYVHKTLFGRRYLIVVDDIWDTEAWDRMKCFLSQNDDGSRVLLTTRDLNIAEHAKSSINPHQLPPISDDASWKLLSLKVFGKDSCPPELVETGRKITSKCGGLPLAVLAISGLFSMSDKTLQFWELVAKNVSSAIAFHDSYCFEILSMSYNYLPYYLKPCFLYVGAFPEFCEIQSSKIIKLWIAEGFIEPAEDKTLEVIAEKFLMALIDANLLLVCHKEPNNRVKTFKIHELMREFCQKKSLEDKFLWFRTFDADNTKGEKKIRRVSAHPLSQRDDCLTLVSVVRSFLCIGRPSLKLDPLFRDLILLRVLDVFQLKFVVFPEEILQLVNLKYLAISCYSDLSSSISRFRNLQALVICRLSSSSPLPSCRPFTLPSGLWRMKQLKHIKSKGTCIWQYLTTGENNIHEKLQTLSNVHISGANNTLFEKIPNLTKLGIFCEASLDANIDLSCLGKLEILKCSSNISVEMTSFLSRLTFPDSLKKLTLSNCNIQCKFMTAIGSLPNLEQLKLQTLTFFVIPTKSEPKPVGLTWEPTEGEFTKLRFLLMEDLNLVKWVADDTHFPILRHLVIRNCSDLVGLPSDFEDIYTLDRIEVDDSSLSVQNSVMDIQRKREDMGNDLEVIVHIAY